MPAIIKYSTQRLMLPALLLVLLAAGCSKKLDITPETFVSPEELYKDEQGAIAGVTGIYRKMMDLNSGDYYFVGIVGTDEGKTSSFVPTWGGYWQHYDGINSYNSLMKCAEPTGAGCLELLVQRHYQCQHRHKIHSNFQCFAKSEGQAYRRSKFLRAVFYFKLVQFFGGVPSPTEVEERQG